MGVQPDIAVAPEQALVAAHAAALKAIAAGAIDANRAAVLRRLIETNEARLRATPEPAARLDRFAGTYEGRAVSVRDGQLWYLRRSGGLGEPLTPLGGDVYALAAVRLRFAESAGAMTLSIEQQDETRVTFRRALKP